MNPVNTPRPPTRKLTVRLLRLDSTPEESLRGRVSPLQEWQRIPGSRLSFGNIGGGDSPEWSKFLELSADERRALRNRSTYALLFIPVDDRWFCVTFGMGHVKLDTSSIENNFGLRVALNELDPDQLRSIDIRKPDSNTLMRRSQTSRGSEQSIFGIDTDQDIVRIIAGKARPTGFATRIAGADSLAIHRQVVLDDLPRVCSEAYTKSQGNAYKQHFPWIDHIAHIRDSHTIATLEQRLTVALTDALAGTVDPSLHLSFPEINDPELGKDIKYRGFRSRVRHPDLELDGYLDSMRERSISEYSRGDLRNHKAFEVDDLNKDTGKNWRIGHCIGFEAVIDERLYVLSGGKWYEIDRNLFEQVQNAFGRLDRVALPPARSTEKEREYNLRVGGVGRRHLCLDQRFVKPAGAVTSIEMCDLLGVEKQLIHVKNGSSASTLSHLFHQGTTGARVLKMDETSRDATRGKIELAESKFGKAGFVELVPSSVERFVAGDFTVVYAVITGDDKPRLTFLSLMGLHRAVRDLRALDYRVAFAWIKRER